MSSRRAAGAGMHGLIYGKPTAVTGAVNDVGGVLRRQILHVHEAIGVQNGGRSIRLTARARYPARR